eukprot:CAMPEP_0178448902 /NCGR_PEP_ID=MMETSP0689_2-20121128/42245_1 /TAXON_ID=160604 /ORGANISM="Amphidinium massartii, Strain CS-259" /LENGTH=704 /DNA_ID=CAMNT_0020074145 /DNA_START=84 /DNA_END=2198 /DNA_ORIENTATION=+
MTLHWAFFAAAWSLALAARIGEEEDISAAFLGLEGSGRETGLVFEYQGEGGSAKATVDDEMNHGAEFGATDNSQALLVLDDAEHGQTTKDIVKGSMDMVKSLEEKEKKWNDVTPKQMENIKKAAAVGKAVGKIMMKLSVFFPAAAPFLFSMGAALCILGSVAEYGFEEIELDLSEAAEVNFAKVGVKLNKVIDQVAGVKDKLLELRGQLAKVNKISTHLSIKETLDAMDEIPTIYKDFVTQLPKKKERYLESILDESHMKRLETYRETLDARGAEAVATIAKCLVCGGAPAAARFWLELTNARFQLASMLMMGTTLQYKGKPNKDHYVAMTVDELKDGAERLEKIAEELQLTRWLKADPAQLEKFGAVLPAQYLDAVAIRGKLMSDSDEEQKAGVEELWTLVKANSIEVALPAVRGLAAVIGHTASRVQMRKSSKYKGRDSCLSLKEDVGSTYITAEKCDPKSVVQKMDMKPLRSAREDEYWQMLRQGDWCLTGHPRLHFAANKDLDDLPHKRIFMDKCSEVAANGWWQRDLDWYSWPGEAAGIHSLMFWKPRASHHDKWYDHEARCVSGETVEEGWVASEADDAWWGRACFPDFNPDHWQRQWMAVQVPICIRAMELLDHIAHKSKIGLLLAEPALSSLAFMSQMGMTPFYECAKKADAFLTNFAHDLPWEVVKKAWDDFYGGPNVSYGRGQWDVYRELRGNP